MYSKWRLAFKYIKYWFTASNDRGHGTHSPFLFHFITKVLNDKKLYPEYVKVEDQRKQLLKVETHLTLKDFGAGSSVSKTDQRTIASIAKNSAKPKKYGQLLFRMVKEYQPLTILELGTSLGITTSYLALANTGAKVISLEGADEVAKVATSNFNKLGVENVNLINGDFDNTLSSVIDSLTSVDFIFIDGNHRQEPTERYFNELLTKVNNDSMIIFDDIHWSKEMEASWETVKCHPDVRCTIDLFFIGIILFRKEFMAKQHFTIRF
jgi:predicted O-methyltransferase YrrM